MNLWYVRERKGPRGRERDIRVTTYIIFAETKEDALTRITEDDEPHDRADRLSITAWPYELSTNPRGSIITHTISFEKVAKKTPPPKNVVDRLGENELFCLKSMRNEDFYDGCGWTWTTFRDTLRMLNRLVEKGYVQKTDDGKSGRFSITEKGRAATES